MTVRRLPAFLIAALLVLPGCGDAEETPAPAGSQGQVTAAPEAATPTATARPKARGTTITLGDSEFGEMLFDARRQAIYIFEKDPKGKTVCYDDCAEAWPPVFTKGDPVAGNGVDESLLGTVKRRDGKLQVTYADQPLYYYAHEEPGEVRCHNINLNGGLWWVVGPDGKRRP